MEYLTTAEVAELKGITERHVRRLCQSDKLEHTEKDDAANNRTEYLVPLAALTEKHLLNQRDYSWALFCFQNPDKKDPYGI